MFNFFVLLSTSQKIEKNLDMKCFVTSNVLLFLKTVVNVPKIRNKQKILVGIWKTTE
jgi:hypothetical protein